LIDCGLFQGQKEWRERNWQDTPIPAREIDAVILTHAHMDHAGWVPRLIKEGFRGAIYATPPTVDLCGVLLPDSGRLQEEEAEYANQRKSSKHHPALPLYTYDEANDSLKYFKPVDFGKTVEPSPEFSFRYLHAAHILGSAMVEARVKTGAGQRTLLFSGDVGRVRDTEVAPGKVISTGPDDVGVVDVLLVESTYGNRNHPHTDPRPQLAEIVRKTAERGGTVVVPAFAVERTQKMLFMLKELMEKGEIPRIPVYADSPMAIQAVKIFIEHESEYSEATRQLVAAYGSPLEWEGFTFASTRDESKKINEARYPAVIISSSGMVTGGRILHHLLNRLPDPRNTVLFIGFQAPGTRGAIIKSGADSVRIFSQPVPIRAQVAALEQFSDHADPPEMLEWLRTFDKPPSATYLVHGEPAAAAGMKQAITAGLGWKVEIAEWMQKVDV
ncbi:MAG: MBL fold metallo-hydrolase RNA specificity domain-containing protein, partial [Terriglobales bacterium]